MIEVETLAGLFDDVDQIAVHERRIEAVDAHRERPLAPVEIVDRLDDVAARLLLLVERDRVFQVEHDDVGGDAPRLLDEPRVRAGHGQLRAVEARIGRAGRW